MIRSYTSWMRNFGPGTFNYTTILVIHPAKKYRPGNVETDNLESIQHKRKQAALKEAGFQIKGLKESYETRAHIAFTLTPLAISEIPQSATISVSIARSKSRYPSPFMNSSSHSDYPTSIYPREEEPQIFT